MCTQNWLSKRNKAIKRLISAWERYEGCADPEEEVMRAIDALAVAHIATKLEWDNGPSKGWTERRDEAIERLEAVWAKHDWSKDDLEAEEELEIALDNLAVAHIAATFEFASGPLTW